MLQLAGEERVSKGSNVKETISVPKTEHLFRTEKEIFHIAKRITFGKEGGINDDPDDLGNNGGRSITNLGVTQDTYAEYIRIAKVELPPLRELKEEDAEKIYRKLFWDRAMCHVLPANVAVLHFDQCINSGCSGGTTLLQKALNKIGAKVSVDGQIGPKTIATVWSLNQAEREELCNKMLDCRLELYAEIIKNKPKQQKYEKGWKTRVGELRTFMQATRGDLRSPNDALDEVRAGRLQIANGDSGAEAYFAQLELKNKKLGTLKTPDGFFGDKSQQDVANFQKKNSLPGTGVLDRLTLFAIEHPEKFKELQRRNRAAN